MPAPLTSLSVRERVGSSRPYLKPKNLDSGDRFGTAVAISGDTVVVTASGEDGNGRGSSGDPDNNMVNNAGAAYVFVRNGTNWSQQAYLKASNTESGDGYGISVAISGDTIVVGASFEKSNATGVNGNGEDNSLSVAGAAYVYVRVGTNWGLQAYLKASNTSARARFGESAAIFGDVIVIGAYGESTVDSSTGAAYVFTRTGSTWKQQALLRGSNTGRSDSFGTSVAVSRETIVVGAPFEDSDASGVNGSEGDVDVNFNSGAAYVFKRHGTNWLQEAYVKASNTGQFDAFGYSVSIFGESIAVGAPNESSDATGINGDGSNDNRRNSGATYVFVRHGTNWIEQAYLKASNAEPFDQFGDVSISGDTLAVATRYEGGGATGINGDQDDNSAPFSGAAYVFGGVGIGPQLSITRDNNTGYFVRGYGVPGLQYQLQRAGDLTGSWTTNGGTTALMPGFIEFHDTNAPSEKAFYRVVQTDSL
jgi:hypothetical protein